MHTLAKTALIVSAVFVMNAIAMLTATTAHASEPSPASQCYGSICKGRIERCVQLTSGVNYSPYSNIATAAGRNYVHSTVGEIMVASYLALEKTASSAQYAQYTHYVYGETGLKNGGRFDPHRTHQNGLSVDFFVPVIDELGKSVSLPQSAQTAFSEANRFGYDIEFDADGKFKYESHEYKIDFVAMAEHLYQLDAAAKAKGVGIALVIFDLPYLPTLFATPRGAYLKQHLHFMKTSAWVRHDEHYHVDFKLPCKP